MRPGPDVRDHLAHGRGSGDVSTHPRSPPRPATRGPSRLMRHLGERTTLRETIDGVSATLSVRTWIAPRYVEARRVDRRSTLRRSYVSNARRVARVPQELRVAQRPPAGHRRDALPRLRPLMPARRRTSSSAAAPPNVDSARPGARPPPLRRPHPEALRLPTHQGSLDSLVERRRHHLVLTRGPAFGAHRRTSTARTCGSSTVATVPSSSAYLTMASARRCRRIRRGDQEKNRRHRATAARGGAWRGLMHRPVPASGRRDGSRDLSAPRPFPRPGTASRPRPHAVLEVGGKCTRFVTRRRHRSSRPARGIAVVQLSSALGQRGWRTRPLGGLTGLGTSPSRMMRRRIARCADRGWARPSGAPPCPDAAGAGRERSCRGLDELAR